jgi:hypothetical protein
LTYGTNQSLFNNGRIITLIDGVSSENYTYNNMGNATQFQKLIGTTTYTTNYAYNEGAALTQITYPSTRVVEQWYVPSAAFAPSPALRRLARRPRTSRPASLTAPPSKSPASTMATAWPPASPIPRTCSSFRI